MLHLSSQSRLWVTGAIIASVFIVSLFTAGMALADEPADPPPVVPAPVLTTDKDDYYPGETVTIWGNFFQSLQTFALKIFGWGKNADNYTEHNATVEADSVGSFIYQYTLDNIFRPLYTVIASTLLGDEVARVTFTDSSKVGSVTVSAQSPNPVTAGASATYTITVNRGSGAGSSGSFTANLSVTTTLPTGATASFSPNPVSFAPSDSSKTATLTISTTGATSAGTTTFTVRAEASASDFATGSGSLVVAAASKLDQTITVTMPAPASAVYGSSFGVAATASSGLPVAITTSGSCSGTGSDSATITMTAGTGTCTVYYNQAGNSLYNPAPQVTSDTTATKATPTATLSVTNSPQTYTGLSQSATVGITASSVPGAVANILTGGAATQTNAGTYPVTADFVPTDTANYNSLLGLGAGNFVIEKKSASVTANNKTKTYGDDNPALDAVVTGTVNGDVLDYTLATTALKFSAVGDYPITVTLGSNPNYEVSKTDGTLTITQKSASVTANNKTKTYGDDNPALDAVVTGTVNGDVLDYTLATTALKFSAVGDYPITVTLGSNPNYEVSKTDGTLTITQKSASVTANNKTKTYGDDNPALDAVVTGTVNGDVLDYTLATTALKFSAVGDYPITVTLGSNPNYEVSKTDGTLTITQKSASVTANNKTKTYGDDNPALDAVVTGTVNGDVLDYTLATTALKFSAVGDYPITVTLGSNPNYEVSKTDGTLTITQKSASVTANNKTKTYGDDNPALDAVVTGTVNGDVLDYTLATTALKFSAVGDYPITVTLGSNPNYEVSKTDGTLTITKKELTVTAHNKSRQYSDPNPAFTYTITGFISGEGESDLTTLPTCSTAATPASAPGNYDITCTGGMADNYSFKYENGTLTVTREDARVTYTGPLFVATASPTSSSATVALAATIQDITAVDSISDPDAGNITNASVKFVNRDGGATLCGPVSVVLVNPADIKTGTAACNWTANIGSDDSKQFTVGIIVNNYYTRDSGDDDTVVTVSKPLTTSFITGGGYLVMSGSAGQYAGTAGTKANFGFNVKYNKGGKNLQGNVNIIVRSSGKVYQIKSNALQSLVVNACPNATLANPCLANFTSKANLTDITDPYNPINLGGNLTLQMAMTDKGEPGKSDSISFVLYNGSALLYSSAWSGTKTVEQLLAGGNLVVH